MPGLLPRQAAEAVKRGKALAALVQAYGIAPGTPEAQAREISHKGLWPETWDGGKTWHEGGNKEKALPAALVAAERAALADKAAELDQALGHVRTELLSLWV